MTKFFFKFKKPIFGPFPQFLGQKTFFKKNWVVMQNYIRVSSTLAKSREIEWSNSKKTCRQMSGGKDEQTLIHWILPATARGLTSTNAVDWNLKAKNKTCNVALIKNYCITVSMQKVSSIHKLIQQILRYHELNDHAQFWPGPPKNNWNNFLLSWICTTMQKISSFHRFILQTQPISESHDQTGHTYFWPCQSKNFLINF